MVPPNHEQAMLLVTKTSAQDLISSWVLTGPSPEGDAMLVAVPPDHLCEVMHELVIVFRPQVVQPGEHIPTGAPRDCHPVGRCIGECLKDGGAPLPRC